MSLTTEEFYAKHAKAWKAITGSSAYRDAIDTIQHTSESLRILDFTPPEVKGIGDIILAKQQGVLETLNALSKLAEVPEDLSDEQPSDNDLYPDPLEELEETNRVTKRTKRK